MFNKNFYPTPLAVASKMKEAVKLYMKENGLDWNAMHILEPSAGKGDLIDLFTEIRYNKPKMYACENEPKLQSILLENEDCKFIGDDFMQLESEVDFNAIVMNPPFDKGMEHFFKAWELLNNGVLVCLLNAANLEKDTQNAQLLKSILYDNKAEVQKLGNCFTRAERKTNVEVVMIVVEKKSESLFDNIDIDGDQEFFEFKDLGQSSEIEVKDLLLQYERRYKAAIEQFKTTSIEVRKLFSLVEPFTEGKRDKYLYRNSEEILKQLYHARFNDFITLFRGAAWDRLLRTSNFQSIMTSKVQEEFTKKFQTQKNFAYTKNNMLNLLSLLYQNKGDILNQSLVEAFDLMTRYHTGNRIHIEGWKNNDAYKVNKKFILPNMWGWSGTIYRLDYQKRHNLDDIDKALCYLTGTPFETNKYNKEGKEQPHIVLASQAIEDDFEKGEHNFESTFFSIKTYKKGTIHFAFKDLKIWDRFNRKVSEIRGFPLPEAKKTPNKRGAQKMELMLRKN